MHLGMIANTYLGIILRPFWREAQAGMVLLSWDSLGSKWYNQCPVKCLWFFGACKGYNYPYSCSHWFPGAFLTVKRGSALCKPGQSPDHCGHWQRISAPFPSLFSLNFTFPSLHLLQAFAIRLCPVIMHWYFLSSSACGRSWASRAGGSLSCAPFVSCGCWSWSASCQPCNASWSSSWRPWTMWPPSACCWCSSSSSLGECFCFPVLSLLWVFKWDPVVGWGGDRVRTRTQLSWMVTGTALLAGVCCPKFSQLAKWDVLSLQNGLQRKSFSWMIPWHRPKTAVPLLTNYQKASC